MTFDIIIIGGGIVGATLACALQKSGLRVAIIDAAPRKMCGQTMSKNGNNTRFIALTYRSYCLFKNIGLELVLAEQAVPIEQVHVSHRGHFGSLCIHAHELKLKSLGYVVPAQALSDALDSMLEQSKTIQWISSATLQALTQDANGVTLSVVTIAGTQLYRANKVIGADGSCSTVRKLLGIPTKKIDYHQSALVTMVQLKRPHKNIAYERFQHCGAIAMLPLNNHSVAAIWTERHEIIAQLMALNEEDFLSRLQQQFGYRLGQLQAIGKRSVFPLQMLQAKQYFKQHVRLIGNAARTLHPIAAQGLNLALYEVAVLVEELLQQKDFAVKKIYPQHNFSLALSHQLTWLFSNDLLPLKLARPIGMIALASCHAAKKRFAEKALGQGGQLIPPLLLNTNS